MPSRNEPPGSVGGGPVAEPTLGEVLTRAVRTTVPTRLYQLLHLALPLAVDFAFRGWWRPAGWAVAVTAFGAWGLADRWLWNSATIDEARSRWSTRFARMARLIAGATAATLGAVLLLEVFLRLLGDAPGH
jgi:hypothetical protein